MKGGCHTMKSLKDKIIVDRVSLIKLGRLRDEWFDNIDKPQEFCSRIKASIKGLDIFTFVQHLPDFSPLFDYYHEMEYFSVIPITNFDEWVTKQINKSAKRSFLKSIKKGVETKTIQIDEEVVKGIHAIYNETPMRQGRIYSNYGKSLSAIRSDLRDNIENSVLLGAFYEKELIGFIKLTCSDMYAVPFGMVSKLVHRDKSPQNALLAKAVEICTEKRIPYLVYGFWTPGSLGDFKRYNGCIKYGLPRYYIPLTTLGKIFLILKLHRGLKGMIPSGILLKLKEIKKYLYTKTAGRFR